MSQPIIFVIAGAVAFLVAMITINWFFRDGDDSTEEMLDFCQQSYRPWWASRFGIWLGLSGGAGVVTFLLLSGGWKWLVSHF